jgi:hypothetical protein
MIPPPPTLLVELDQIPGMAPAVLHQARLWVAFTRVLYKLTPEQLGPRVEERAALDLLVRLVLGRAGVIGRGSLAELPEDLSAEEFISQAAIRLWRNLSDPQIAPFVAFTFCTFHGWDVSEDVALWEASRGPVVAPVIEAGPVIQAGPVVVALTLDGAGVWGRGADEAEATARAVEAWTWFHDAAPGEGWAGRLRYVQLVGEPEAVDALLQRLEIPDPQGGADDWR